MKKNRRQEPLRFINLDDYADEKNDETPGSTRREPMLVYYDDKLPGQPWMNAIDDECSRLGITTEEGRKIGITARPMSMKNTFRKSKR